MEITGKTTEFSYEGRSILFYNQQSLDWTHPYEWEGNGSDLHKAGCGIFSMAAVIQYLCGKRIDIEEFADFSVKCGGRGDDGTDRPQLLAGMVDAGLDEEYGFSYTPAGLENNQTLLWNTLAAGGGAMCNLRVGHIVALVGCRKIRGERQVLVIDCDAESSDRRVRESVREVIPESMVINYTCNERGVEVGVNASYGMYWVPLEITRDFNLIGRR